MAKHCLRRANLALALCLWGRVATATEATPVTEAPPVSEAPPPTESAPSTDPQAAAIEDVSGLSLPAFGDVRVQLHGFVSQGFYITNRNNYLGESSRGSFEFTEGGLSVAAELSESLRVGMQLFARDIGDLGNYAVKLDWFNLDYRFADWLGVRAGRIKMPFGLYNHTSDIDSARVPILLPQAMYPIGNRDFLLAVTGGELYGYIDLGPVGGLEYRAYGGTIFVDLQESSSGGPLLRDVDVPYTAGGRLIWNTPLPGLRFGGSVQALRLDLTVGLDAQTIAELQGTGALPADFPGTFPYALPAVLGVGSVEYQTGDLLLAAEYSRWWLESKSGLPSLYPSTQAINERGYAMASYRLTSWLHPGAYYAVHFPDSTKRSGARNVQHDIALSVRFDLTSFWLLKLEAHVFNGTALLSAADNPRPKRDWLLFLAKTTAYF